MKNRSDLFILFQGSNSNMAEKAPKKLTILLLQILQVETQKRPYNRLVLDGKYFIEKLERICDAENLAIISEFLKFKSIQDFELSYINIPEESYNLLIHSFSGLTSIC